MDSFEIHSNRGFGRDVLEIDLRFKLTKCRVHITFAKSFLPRIFKQMLGETPFNSPYYYYLITSEVCGRELGNSGTVLENKRLSSRKIETNAETKKNVVDSFEKKLSSSISSSLKKHSCKLETFLGECFYGFCGNNFSFR